MPLLKWSSKYTSRKFKEDKTMHRITKHLYFLILLTMQKVQYTIHDRIEAVGDLIQSFWKVVQINEENYLAEFALFINAMVDQLGFDKTKDGQSVNQLFVDYLQNEFVPQYAKILGEDPQAYINAINKKINLPL